MTKRFTRSSMPNDSKYSLNRKPPNNTPAKSIVTKMRTFDDQFSFAVELNKLLDRNDILCKENCQLKRSLRARDRELTQIKQRISKLESSDENCSPPSVNNGREQQQRSHKRMKTRAWRKEKEESDEGYDGWSSDEHAQMDVTVVLTRMSPEELQRYSAPVQDKQSRSVQKPCNPVQKPSKMVLKERSSNDQWSSTFLKHDFYLNRFLNVM
ncbi:uncharacterized protein LOC141857604 [Brevipalpus obovatus]|uniref:uncharacterized protein LOC141857604 n=1 Tax=Brevipalpus obovatus TaxID=246614 RepID=UPI003D9E9ECB